jgi:MFS family permease
MSGVLTASYPASTLLFSLPGAWVATQIGPKRTVLASLAVLAVASLGFGLAAEPGTLIAARAVQGVGAAGIWSGALAWVVAFAPRERRAETIGIALGAAIAGALGGPVLGAAAAEIGRDVVFAAFVALPVALIAAGWRFPAAPAVATPGLFAFATALTDPQMRRGWWLMTLPAMGFGVMNVLVPLRFDDLGAGAIAIGAAFFAAVVLEAMMSPFVGRLADRRGALWPARIGLASGGIALALIPAAQVAVLVGVGVAVASPLLGMLWAPAMSVLSDGAESRGIDPAFGFGMANLGYGGGAAIGGAAGGALAQATADAVPFVVLAVVCVTTAVVLRASSREPVRLPVA